MSFSHIENSFFDIYANVVSTQNKNKQKYFLPIVKSDSKPLGLKNVSECLSYREIKNRKLNDIFGKLSLYTVYLTNRRVSND